MPRTITTAVGYLVLTSLAILMLVPFIWMLSTSLMTQEQTYQWPPHIIPDPLLWSNYPEAWATQPFGRMFANSVLVSAVVVVVEVALAILAAYAFARIEFPGRQVLFYAYLVTMMVPFYVRLIPLFLVIRNLGWINTYFALTVPNFFSAFGVFLLRQFFMTIPKELEDAAIVDGCGVLGVLLRIILPISGAGIAALSILIWLQIWNQFVWPLVVTNTDQMRTMVVGVGMFAANVLAYGTHYPYQMAMAVVTILPVLAVFAIGQRFFIEGVMLSGLKG